MKKFLLSLLAFFFLSSNCFATISTFYPIADGRVTDLSDGTWATVLALSGNWSNTGASPAPVYQISAIASSNQWDAPQRGILMFDTASLPDDDTISAGVVSIYGQAKVDGLSITPSLNLYSVNTASETGITATDYAQFGSTEYSTDISYSSWSTSAYNAFTLNATGIAAIDVSGKSKFGARDTKYDVTGTPPSWSSSQLTSFTCYFVEETGTANDPKLVVTHEAAAADFTPQIIILD
jgi:hypothetical protein